MQVNKINNTDHLFNGLSDIVSQIEVTRFNHLYKTTRPTIIPLIEALYNIKTGVHVKDQIEKIQKAETKEEVQKIKQNLPGVCFSGIFSKRGRDGYKSSSGLACLDFDKLFNIDEVFKELTNDKYILACWKSPSQKGIKALVRIPIVRKTLYKDHYNALIEKYRTLGIDPVTSDITRFCFESYDPNIYINKYAEVFTDTIQATKTEVKLSSPVLKDLSYKDKLNRITKWWLKNYSMTDGSRNNNLFVYACTLNGIGLLENQILEVCSSFEQSGFTLSEIKNIVKSAIKRSEHNSITF